MVRSNTSCVMVTWDLPVYRQTDITENITFPHICGRAVIRKVIMWDIHTYRNKTFKCLVLLTNEKKPIAKNEIPN